MNFNTHYFTERTDQEQIKEIKWIIDKFIFNMKKYGKQVKQDKFYSDMFKGYVIGFPNILEKYPELYFVLKNEMSGKLAMRGSYQPYKPKDGSARQHYISLNIFKDFNFDKPSIWIKGPIIEYIKEILSHELRHYLDSIKTDSKSFRAYKTKFDADNIDAFDYKAYFQDFAEYNAHFSETLYMMTDLYMNPRKKEKYIQAMDYFKSNFDNFKKIYMYHLDIITGKKKVFDILDQSMKNRLLKRLYDFWDKNVKDKE